MKRIALVISLAALTLTFATPPARAADPQINLVASNWKFAPSTITVHMNQPVTLKVSSSQGVHGIYSSELGIANTMITPGKTMTIKVTPKKKGTYVVHCTVFCGAGHANMTFTVKVV